MRKAWSPPSDTTLTKPTRRPSASRAVTQPRLCGRMRSHHPTSAFPPWALTSSTISASVNGPRQRYVTPLETNCGRTAGEPRGIRLSSSVPAPRPLERLGPSAPAPGGIGPPVLPHLDGRPSASVGERLVVEARDDVQVRVLRRLLDPREAVPNERVPVRRE